MSDADVLAERERIAKGMERERAMYVATARFARDPELIELRIKALDRYIAFARSNRQHIDGDE